MSDLAGLELLLTDAFARYGGHLAYGKVTRRKSSESEPDVVYQTLTRLDQQGSVDAALRNLAPTSEMYWRLKSAAGRLKKVVDGGGWPTLPAISKMKPGYSGPEVQLLRERLRLSGDLLTYQMDDVERLNLDLELALKMFQSRHGLKITGQVDKATVNALNTPARTRYEQVLPEYGTLAQAAPRSGASICIGQCGILHPGRIRQRQENH